MQVANESDRLVKRILELLESGNFADAEIICNGRVWKVHKLILRSGCVWFDKAFNNNWMEAQTGQIHVREQHPDQVHDLLKFIYSGRYVPELAPDLQVISKPNLETHVSLWLTADFFMLPGLKTEVYDYLFKRITTTIGVLYNPKNAQPIRGNNASVKQGIDAFFADFSRAVKKAYECPAAREIHKLLTVFARAMRMRLPEPTFSDLMKTPGFQKDMAAILVRFHCAHPTKLFMPDTMPRTSYPTTTVHCRDCDKDIEVARFSEEEYWNMALDPFSAVLLTRCRCCASPCIETQLKVMITGWPAEPDQI